MRVVGEVVRGLWESVCDLLPRSEAEVASFGAGFFLAFVLHWITLIAVTYAHCAARGGC